MVKVEGYEFPEELYYSERHLWFKKETDGTLTIGLDDLGQKLLGNATFVRLMKEGTQLTPEKYFGTIESLKWIERLRSPITGIIVKSNDEVKQKPSLVNEDPYGAGWLVKVKPTGDLDKELSKLIHGDSLKKWVENEIWEKLKKR
ncbi:MAG: glycine cleavage system protein H [Candidatus Bathyarchaeia archaeon]